MKVERVLGALSCSLGEHLLSEDEKKYRKIEASQCGVNAIGPLPQTFWSMQKLYLSHNRLKSLEGIESLPCLVTLSLGFNQIENVEELMRIKPKGRLRFLGVVGNPLCRHPDYRRRILNLFPVLETLDDLKIDRRSLSDIYRLCNKASRMIIPVLEYCSNQNQDGLELLADWMERVRLDSTKVFLDVNVETEFYKRILEDLVKILATIEGEAKVELSVKAVDARFKRIFRELTLFYLGEKDYSLDVWMKETLIKNLEEYEADIYIEKFNTEPNWALHEMQQVLTSAWTSAASIGTTYTMRREGSSPLNDTTFQSHITSPQQGAMAESTADFPVFPLNNLYIRRLLLALRRIVIEQMGRGGYGQTGISTQQMERTTGQGANDQYVRIDGVKGYVGVVDRLAASRSNEDKVFMGRKGRSGSRERVDSLERPSQGSKGIGDKRNSLSNQDVQAAGFNTQGSSFQQENWRGNHSTPYGMVKPPLGRGNSRESYGRGQTVSSKVDSGVKDLLERRKQARLEKERLKNIQAGMEKMRGLVGKKLFENLGGLFSRLERTAKLARMVKKVDSWICDPVHYYVARPEYLSWAFKRILIPHNLNKFLEKKVKRVRGGIFKALKDNANLGERATKIHTGFYNRHLLYKAFYGVVRFSAKRRILASKLFTRLTSNCNFDLRDAFKRVVYVGRNKHLLVNRHRGGDTTGDRSALDKSLDTKDRENRLEREISSVGGVVDNGRPPLHPKKNWEKIYTEGSRPDTDTLGEERMVGFGKRKVKSSSRMPSFGTNKNQSLAEEYEGPVNGKISKKRKKKRRGNSKSISRSSQSNQPTEGRYTEQLLREWKQRSNNQGNSQTKGNRTLQRIDSLENTRPRPNPRETTLSFSGSRTKPPLGSVKGSPLYSLKKEVATALSRLFVALDKQQANPPRERSKSTKPPSRSSSVPRPPKLPGAHNHKHPYCEVCAMYPQFA